MEGSGSNAADWNGSSGDQGQQGSRAVQCGLGRAHNGEGRKWIKHIRGGSPSQWSSLPLPRSGPRRRGICRVLWTPPCAGLTLHLSPFGKEQLPRLPWRLQWSGEAAFQQEASARFARRAKLAKRDATLSVLEHCRSQRLSSPSIGWDRVGGKG